MVDIVIQTTEPYSTIEATKRVVKLIDSIYDKSCLDKISENAVQLYANQHEMLLGILKELEGLFDGTLGKWDTSPIDLEVNTGSKPFNSRYCMVPKINTETFYKELQRLVEIRVLMTIQQSQYGTPIFIKP